MSGRSPRPRSAERLSLRSIDDIYAPGPSGDGVVTITVTLDYYPWGDGGVEDGLHAARAVERMIRKSADRAMSKRERRLLAEVEEMPIPYVSSIDPASGRHRVLLENTNQWIVCHPPDKCATTVCCLHNRSDHRLRSWPQHWRSDRYMMERVCPHGVGHPDPDDFSLFSGHDNGIHGCDGCCCDPGEASAPLTP